MQQDSGAGASSPSLPAPGASQPALATRSSSPPLRPGVLDWWQPAVGLGWGCGDSPRSVHTQVYLLMKSPGAGLEPWSKLGGAGQPAQGPRGSPTPGDFLASALSPPSGPLHSCWCWGAWVGTPAEQAKGSLSQEGRVSKSAAEEEVQKSPGVTLRQQKLPSEVHFYLTAEWGQCPVFPDHKPAEALGALHKQSSVIPVSQSGVPRRGQVTDPG